MLIQDDFPFMAGVCLGERVIDVFDGVAADAGRNEKGETPPLDLSHWASLGDMKSVRHVLDTEGTGLINRKDEMGVTALMQAPERNTVAVVELVLQRKADVDETDPDDQTALHYAASCGHVEAALKLVGDGESPQKRDTEGLSARNCKRRGKKIS